MSDHVVRLLFAIVLTLFRTKP